MVRTTDSMRSTSAPILDASSRLPVVLANGSHHTADSIVSAWLEGKATHTIRGYETDLARFAAYVAAATPLPSVGAALDIFFAQTAPAHEIALGFRTWLLRANLSPCHHQPASGGAAEPVAIGPNARPMYLDCRDPWRPRRAASGNGRPGTGCFFIGPA
jgi:hypothetical protein